ncbi:MULTISPECIES: hypothetical protein [Flavobacterium]|uniref:Uncharacterized protein n=1 Tax=Flavobacterium jumunjinense TaxID=998845 RepID=A0ABV5GRQ1_9FLAO|nr:MULTISPECIES: hypothetical protein [Flavobacterium]
MDIPNLIMGITLFAVILLPILLINKKVLEKRKRIIAKINAFAQLDNKQIGEFDAWTDNSIIGISNDNTKLYFLRKTETYDEKMVVELKDIKNCSIASTYKTGTKNIDKLELAIELYSSNTKVYFEFFKVDEKNFMMGEEMRIAKKWSEKLTPEFPKNKVLLYNI